jgi:hypothetical protein
MTTIPRKLEPTRISVLRKGHTGKAFRLQVGSSIFDIRTRSSRRYLVVNLRGHWVEKRTDNIETALRAASKSVYYITIDTRVGGFVTSRYSPANSVIEKNL